MATATLTNTPTVIDNAESISNWGGDSFSLEPDIKVQGSNSVACTQTNNGTNDVYVSGSWNFSTDVHLRLWVNSSIVAPYGKTEANDGVQIFLYDGTNTAYWTVGGSDTYDGGWKQFVVYTGNSPTSGSVTKSSITRIGVRINTSSKPRNVTNGWYDAWTYGNGYTITGGTSGDEIDWSHIASVDKTSAYGIVSEVDGVYFLSGDITIGSGSTTTYFKDEGQIAVFKDLSVSSTLYKLTFAGSGCHVEIDGGVYSAAGSQDFGFDADDSNLSSFSMKNKQLSNVSTSYFKSGQTITNDSFNGCGQIIPTTATFKNNTIANYVGTTGAVVFPSDDSNFSDLIFINCDNCIEYKSTSDSSSPNLTNITFDDSSGNYDINNTSGSSVSLNNVGSNGNSYNPGGSSVTFVSNPVTLKLVVKDTASPPVAIQSARALVWVTDSTNFPYQASVSITSSGTTATVTHTSHGLATNDNVIIEGANEDAYNGAYQITVTDSNTYTYTMSETTTSPATGTIKSTFAYINGVTNSSGEISDTRSISSDQPIKGWIRKSSSSPYYKQGNVLGTVDSSNGLTVNLQLISDE